MSISATGTVLLTSFVAVLVAMPVLIRLAPRLGLLDRPDARKRHAGSVPLVGGLALILGLSIGLAEYLPVDQRLAWLWLGGALLAAAGGVDDRRGLTPAFRFSIQTLACLLMSLAAGVVLADFGELLWPATLPLGWLAVPVTLFCVVGVTNAVNMIDGMDGLSASLALVCLLGVLSAAWHAGWPLSALPEVTALAGGLCAYLLFNMRLPWRPRALAFFGDAGTLLLGFLLGWILVERSQGPERLFAPVTALWLLAVPLMDTVFVMIKRRRAGRDMTAADREHVHHAFLRSGRSVGLTLLSLTGLAAGLAVTGLALERFGVPEYLSYYLFLALCAVYYGVMSRAWARRRFLGRDIQ